MPFQTIFRRYELKYMITLEQKEKLMAAINAHMHPDKYGKSTIRNLYYDTDTYLLIRRSIEKPVYKEKLRIRSYERAKDDSNVFVELKKKYKGIVYKRRQATKNGDAMSWLAGDTHPENYTQITNEIAYFLKFYKNLEPKIFLSYEREAYFSNDGADFRITFDRNILCRTEDLTLDSEVYGTSILPPNKVLMEIKCSGGIPIWMSEILSKEKIYKTPFSKYGTAYKTLIFPKNHKINVYNMLEVNLNA